MTRAPRRPSADWSSTTGLQRRLESQSVKRKGNLMSATNTFLAVFLGSKTNPQMTAWNALPEAERLAKQQEGIAAWKAWAEKHQTPIVRIGRPLGQTQKSLPPGHPETHK